MPTAFSMLALVLAVLGVAAPLAADDQHRLVGVWRFLREVDTKADGSPAPVAALSDCDGLLIYTADGFVSVNIMPKGRTWSTDTATLDEFRETVGNGTAYAGRYEVDTSAYTVTNIHTRRNRHRRTRGRSPLCSEHRTSQGRTVSRERDDLFRQRPGLAARLRKGLAGACHVAEVPAKRPGFCRSEDALGGRHRLALAQDRGAA